MAPATALALERLYCVFSPCCLLLRLLCALLECVVSWVSSFVCPFTGRLLCKGHVLLCFQNVHFLGSTVLPWPAMVLPRELRTVLRTQHDSNFLLPMGKRYYRPRCGTS